MQKSLLDSDEEYTFVQVAEANRDLTDAEFMCDEYLMIKLF